MINNNVSIIKVENYNIKDALYNAIKSIDDIKFPLNSNIIIKPNLCTFMGPESGATTDIKIVQELIELINNETNNMNNIYIVESKSISGGAKSKFKRLGYNMLEKIYDNVKLINLEKDKIYNIKFPENNRLKVVKIPEIFLKSQYFISVAKLKTNVEQKISCVLKNQFGCIPGDKKKYHPWLTQVIADINHVLKPDLCIVDGIVAMEGNGPVAGTPKLMNLIIAGENPVTTDAVAARIMGFNPQSIPHLKRSIKRRIGSIKDIEIKGENIADIKEKFKFIPYYAYFILRISDAIQRMADRILKFSNLIYLAGLFFINAKNNWMKIRDLSIPQIKNYIQEGQIGE